MGGPRGDRRSRSGSQRPKHFEWSYSNHQRVVCAPSSDFTDITTGSTQYESAGVGYDLATGLGTPKANLLIPYLAGTGSGTTTTTTVPAVPASISATAASSTSVTVSWLTSTGATGYDLYELENGQTVLIGSYAAGTTSASVSGLSASTTYSFQVAADNSVGSNATKWTQVTTPAAAVVVTAPQNFHVAASSSTTAALSWQAVSGATGYRVYEWNGSSAVLIGNLAAGSTSVNVSGLTAGSTQYFYITAFNATSSASTAWVSVVMPAAASTAPTAPVVTATATSSTTGKLSWTASPGATGYQIDYLSHGQAVSLGSVGSSATSVVISGMSAGTTYQFAIVAYNSTTQAASAWTALTTTSSAAHAAGKAAFDIADDASLPLLNVGVTFNGAAVGGSSVGGLAAGTAAVMLTSTLGGVFNQMFGGTSSPGTGNIAVGGVGSAIFNAPSRGEVFNAKTALDVATAGQDGSLSESWDDFAGSLAGGETSSAEHEMMLLRRSLVDSLDSLFGQDIEWADTQTKTTGGASSSVAMSESTGAVAGVSESDRPSAAMLAVGLALAALWSEDDEDDCVNPTEPRRSPLWHRQASP